MRINSLTLRHFGKHEQVSINAKAAVIGLIGANGSGKSTVLDALEFALTGSLRDNAASYVMNGAETGSVSLEFEKNGKIGRIFRQIGKTTKRKLMWDGQEITAAREIDKWLESIFGADRQAVANAVFINQGMLENILFAPTADRKTLFVRLVNMAFCESRVRVIEQKRKELAGSIQDLGPVLDAATALRQQSMEEWQRLQKDLEKLPSHKAELEQVVQYLDLEQQVTNLSTQIGTTQNQVVLSQNELDRKLTATGCASIQELRQQDAELEAEHKKATEHLNWIRSVYTELVSYMRLQQQLEELRRKSSGLQQELTVIDPSNYGIQGWSDQLTQWRFREKALLTIQQAELRVEVAEKKVREFRDTLNTLVPPVLSEAGLQEKLEEKANRSVGLSILKTQLQQQQELAECFQASDIQAGKPITCTKCGLKIANPTALLPEERQRLEQLIKTDQATFDALTLEIQKLQQAWSDYHKDVRYNNQALEQAVSELHAASATLQTMDPMDPALTLEGIQAQQASIEDLLATVRTKTALIGNLQQQQNDITNTKLPTFKLAVEYWDRRSKFTDKELHKAQTTVDALTSRQRSLQPKLQEVAFAIGQLEQAETNLINWKQKQSSVTAQLNAITFLPYVARLVQKNADLSAVKQELEVEQQARDMLQGQVQQAEVNYKCANTRFLETQERIAKDAVKRQVVDELNQLRELLQVDGLPMAVVNHHWKPMVQLTRKALKQLNANFDVFPDDNAVLSFRFVRTDGATEGDLSMTKLSGGQRVRLCTAFLMAVQERLVKDVGLLVLDEPSVHMDAEGVESLADLLRSLQTKLRNTEMQIWVSDHAPALADCFEKVVQLKN